MGRKPTGSTYQSRGVWYAAITMAHRKRESFALPTCTTKEQADARADIVNDVVQRLRGAGHAALTQQFAQEAAERPGGKDLARLVNTVNALCCGTLVPADTLLDTATIRDVGEAWTSGKLAEQYRGKVKPRKGADHIARALEKHVYPHVGDLPVRLFEQKHAQLVLNKYPPTNDPDSALALAKLLNRIINLAVKPLKLIPRSPLEEDWMPERGPAKARSCIYPAEDVQLMACAAVPLAYRILWGYLHREGHRSGEVFLLTWSDIDLVLGTVNLDKNKTNQPRFWVLAPGVAATLRAWKRYREERLGRPLTGGDLVFIHPGTGRKLKTGSFAAAETYRDNLMTAGIDRPQLHEHDGTRRRVRAHDTRAAFVTVALANNRNDVWISDRTGHSSLTEMETYRRNARTFAALNLGDFTPLDQLIPELLPYLDRVEQEVPTATSSAKVSAAMPAQQGAHGGVAAVRVAGNGTPDESGHAADGDGPTGIVGAIVGGSTRPGRGSGFVGPKIWLDFPPIMAATSLPTFAGSNSPARNFWLRR